MNITKKVLEKFAEEFSKTMSLFKEMPDDRRLAAVQFSLTEGYKFFPKDVAIALIVNTAAVYLDKNMHEADDVKLFLHYVKKAVATEGLS